MTRAQATKLAKAKWGKRALLEDRGWRHEPSEHFPRFSVGHHVNLIGISFFHVEGQGDSWEAAAKAARLTP